VRANERVQRTSTVTGVQHKEGRSGPLLFVTVEHEFGTERGVAIRERQDIVYRDHSTATVDGIAVDAGEWCSRVLPTEVLLFRYSALTFNAHRIHHDLRYAGEVEGYPGLVVHGPLMATLLARCAASTVGPLRSFEFRATKPVIAPSPIEICGARTDKGCTMWVRDVRGHQCVAATVTAAT
jgi:hydroxyacyl-ACP dehydratase HTD2-like protein with hotdog domain